MVKKTFALSILMATSSVFAATAVTVSGGTVNFNGSIVNAACAVASDSINQTVNMGQVKATDLAVSGSVASAVPFNINLQDCDTSVATTAAVTFTGVAASGAPTDLAAGTGASPAKNLAIRLFDSAGTAVVLGSVTKAVNLVGGSNRLPFVAKYYTALGGVTAGDASATTTFLMTYQ